MCWQQFCTAVCVILAARVFSLSSAANVNQFELAESGASICPASLTVSVRSARSDIECSVICSDIDTCKSFSYVTADSGSVTSGCLMSDRDNCSLAVGAPTFKKNVPVSPAPAIILIDCGSPIVSPMAAGTAVMFMQRFLGNVNFTRPWADYDAGFGNCSGDFWLGLRNLNILLGSGSATWRVEMKLRTGADVFVEYSGFTVGDASTNYYMGYSAMANRSSQVTTDGMSDNKNVGFSTMDRDNDRYSASCTQTYNGQGGFWFGSCGRAFPTAGFPQAATTSFGFMIWDFSGVYTSLREVRMYLKR